MSKVPVFYRFEMVAKTDSFSPSAAKPMAVVTDWLDNGMAIEIMPFERAPMAALWMAHDLDYVRGVLNRSLPNGFGNTDVSVADSLRWTTGSMVAAAYHALTSHDRIVCSPTSGFHHAGFHFGSGFCTFNGLVIAAMNMKAQGLVDTVGILDCDHHHGNGTEQIINHLRLGSWLKHWPAGTKSLYKTAMRQVDLQSVDLLLYQAGADMHEDDPLGGDMSTSELRRRDAAVFAARGNRPTVWNLAGGYQTDRWGGIEPVLEIHRNTMNVCIEIVEAAHRNERQEVAR